MDEIKVFLLLEMNKSWLEYLFKERLKFYINTYEKATNYVKNE